jgi:predicted nicotinamide N-methyase
MSFGSEAQRDFVQRNTRLTTPTLVPEIALHLADAMTPLWQATERELAATGVPPPYWAFAWPGGQALARLLFDRRDLVAGKRVFVFAAGAGLEAIAACRALAADVVAVDIDAMACVAVSLNAEVNAAVLEIRCADPLAEKPPAADFVFAADIYYEAELARRAHAWLGACVAAGARVLIADCGRSYFPTTSALRLLARYDVPTSRDLEDAAHKETSVYELLSS